MFWKKKKNRPVRSSSSAIWFSLDSLGYKPTANCIGPGQQSNHQLAQSSYTVHCIGECWLTLTVSESEHRAQMTSATEGDKQSNLSLSQLPNWSKWNARIIHTKFVCICYQKWQFGVGFSGSVKRVAIVGAGVRYVGQSLHCTTRLALLTIICMYLNLCRIPKNLTLKFLRYNCWSGLAAAYKLKSHGFDVTVLEAEGRAGGKLRSVSYNGLIWDEGANTMVSLLVLIYGRVCKFVLYSLNQCWVTMNVYCNDYANIEFLWPLCRLRVKLRSKLCWIIWGFEKSNNL